jgi:ribosomal RNA-processing protein 7
MSKRQRISSAAGETSYNGFRPIPIKVQDRDAANVKKSVKGKGKASDISSAVHYLWVRQHRAPKAADAGSDATALPSHKTLFVANLPVDTTERDVRLMFGTYGGIDRVEFKFGEIGRMGREGDPWWTVEDDEEENEDSDDSDEESDVEEEEQEADAMQAEDEETEQSADPTLTKRERRRLARKQQRADPEFAINALRRKAPQVVPLPPLNPRTSANGQGYLAPCSGCYVVYLDELSVTRCLELAGAKGITTWERATSQSTESEDPTGLSYYRRLHALLRPSLEIIKQHADTSIGLFDWHANLSSERAKRGAITDDDGFTLVVRGGKFGRTAGKGEKGVAVASRRFMLDSKRAVKKNVVGASAEEMGKEDDMLDAREGLTRGKKRKAQQLEGFYKFQRDEERRSRKSVGAFQRSWLTCSIRPCQHSGQFRGRQGQGGEPQGCQAVQAVLVNGSFLVSNHSPAYMHPVHIIAAAEDGGMTKGCPTRTKFTDS